MKITMDDLIVNFDHLDREQVLQDWRWLVGESKHPILVTAMGDAFLQDEEDNSVWGLDVDQGATWKVADSAEAFAVLMTNEEWVRGHMAADAVGELRERGVELETGQVYSLKQPAVLNGEYAVENIEPCDMAVHFSVLGKMQEKLRDVPDGSQVSGYTIVHH